MDEKKEKKKKKDKKDKATKKATLKVAKPKNKKKDKTKKADKIKKSKVEPLSTTNVPSQHPGFYSYGGQNIYHTRPLIIVEDTNMLVGKSQENVHYVKKKEPPNPCLVCFVVAFTVLFLLLIASTIFFIIYYNTGDSKHDWSKILVVTGSYDTGVASLNLNSSTKSCDMNHVKSFPLGLTKAIGGLADKKDLVVCGGEDIGGQVHDECHILDEDGYWQKRPGLLTGRTEANAIIMPNGALLVTGGKNSAGQLLQSGEAIFPERTSQGQTLPEPVSGHCMAVINTTTLILTGGSRQDDDDSRKTHYLDIGTGTWTDGPLLQTGRRHHSCGILQDFHEYKHTVVVAGGTMSSTGLNTVEILPQDSDSWEFGPDLPKPFVGATILEEQGGTLIIIGGNLGPASGYAGNKDLMRLSCSTCDWVRLSHEIPVARDFPVSILGISDDMLNCR